jgi:hypothetical protein
MLRIDVVYCKVRLHYETADNTERYVRFPAVTTHCDCIFYSPVAGFSLLVYEVS